MNHPFHQIKINFFQKARKYFRHAVICKFFFFLCIHKIFFIHKYFISYIYFRSRHQRFFCYKIRNETVVSYSASCSIHSAVFLGSDVKFLKFRGTICGSDTRQSDKYNGSFLFIVQNAADVLCFHPQYEAPRRTFSGVCLYALSHILQIISHLQQRVFTRQYCRDKVEIHGLRP